jgi:hypothetical protein
MTELYPVQRTIGIFSKYYRPFSFSGKLIVENFTFSGSTMRLFKRKT